MKQSRRMSLVEALANVAVGFGVAVATQIAVFPLFGLYASPPGRPTIFGASVSTWRDAALASVRIWRFGSPL